MNAAEGVDAQARALADLVELSAPLAEAATGLRETLKRGGWSDLIAEHIAAEWLVDAHRAMWRKAMES